ncbi:MAG: oligosaccharide flippase family protein, partial [Pseudomonadota bacterium]
MLNTLKEKIGQLLQGGLRAKIVRGATWTLVGFGASQVIRLGLNLFMAALLVPQDFGVVALAMVFYGGLNMMSDVGINASVIQSERGENPRFLSTAWTLQILRGCAIALILCLVAAPVASFYEESVLLPILFWFALVAFSDGFISIG